MALLNCVECGKELSSEARACPHCGAPNPHRSSGWGAVGKFAMWAIALLLVFMGYGCYKVSTDPDAAERGRQRNAIAYCEDQYEKLKEDPGMTRGALSIAYGACERMKDEYREKWNRDP